MHTTVIAFCDICKEDVDALIEDCDFCVEKRLQCLHLVCTLCSADL